MPEAICGATSTGNIGTGRPVRDITPRSKKVKQNKKGKQIIKIGLNDFR